MSNFAEIDENNIVLRVLVGDNDLPNEGLDWFVENLGGTWIQTSYSGSFRKNYAGVGHSYDSGRDAFIAPKLFESWVLDEDTCQWQAPTPYPNDDKAYLWNEETVSWQEIPEA